MCKVRNGQNVGTSLDIYDFFKKYNHELPTLDLINMAFMNT